MGGRSSRNKGKRGERLLRDQIREAFPEYADGVQRGGMLQSRGGKEGADVVGLPGVWWEHKCSEGVSPESALRQAISDSEGTGRIPIAVIKRSRKPSVSCLLLSDLFRLIRDGREITGLEKQHGTQNQRSGRSIVRRNDRGGWRILLRASH